MLKFALEHSWYSVDIAILLTPRLSRMAALEPAEQAALARIGALAAKDFGQPPPDQLQGDDEGEEIWATLQEKIPALLAEVRRLCPQI
jgi:hypothetical protein